MGTWGTGPFDNDQAGDLFGDLAELDHGGKVEHLRELFDTVLRPEADQQVWPKEVIAGAALVALVLPGGGVVLDWDEDYDPDDEENAADDWAHALVRAPQPALISQALAALRATTAPDSLWFTTWVRDSEDREERVAQIERIARVLEQRSSTLDPSPSAASGAGA